jgi:hypothetical protein
VGGALERTAKLGLLLACVAPTPSGHAALGQISAEPDASERELLEFVVLQNTEARNRINSVVYAYSFEAVRYVTPSGPSRSRGDGQVTQRGNDRATIFRNQVERNGVAGPTVEARTLLTDALFAARPSAGNPVVQYARTSADVVDEPFFRLMWATAGTDMLKYGFGSGTESLQDLVAADGSSSRWRVYEEHAADGRALFRVARFTTLVRDPAVPTMELVVDPAQGFLVTSFVARVADGSLGMRRTVRVEPVGPGGVWFPMEVHETVYEPWITTSEAARKRLRGAFHVDDEGRKVSGTTTTRITSLQINELIDGAAFTVAAAFEVDDPASVVHEPPHPDPDGPNHPAVAGPITNTATSGGRNLLTISLLAAGVIAMIVGIRLFRATRVPES